MIKNNVSDLLKYKKAKIISKDLDIINQKLLNIYKDLYPYKKYVPVLDILKTISENKVILNLHLKKNKKIVENKGLNDTQ